jgi:predicted nucleic acid-binding protein
MIVLDASVIVKWFIPEVGAVPAKALLAAGDELIAPELARIEVASALIRKGLREELTGADVESTLRAWFRALSDGQVFLLPNSDDIEAAVKHCSSLSPTASTWRSQSASAWPWSRPIGPSPVVRHDDGTWSNSSRGLATEVIAHRCSWSGFDPVHLHGATAPQPAQVIAPVTRSEFP